ncbi:MAG: 4'-phosphopantetheinyl transferase family protein [Pseudobdellovibrionaceae bacterium]
MLIFEARDPEERFLLQIHKFVDGFHEVPESFLSPEELQYFHQVTNEKRKAEYLQSRFVLKSLLAKRLALLPQDLHFQKIGEGKPVLNMPVNKTDFNLSHSGQFFAIVLSEKGQVGVDIEKKRAPEHLKKIAEKFFSAKETELIQKQQNSQNQIEIFSKLWSGKEALIKTVGGGVFKNVQDVEIDVHSWEIKKLPADFGELSQWYLQFFENIEGYICSVSFKSST